MNFDLWRNFEQAPGPSILDSIFIEILSRCVYCLDPRDQRFNRHYTCLDPLLLLKIGYCKLNHIFAWFVHPLLPLLLLQLSFFLLQLCLIALFLYNHNGIHRKWIWTTMYMWTHNIHMQILLHYTKSKIQQSTGTPGSPRVLNPVHSPDSRSGVLRWDFSKQQSIGC